PTRRRRARRWRYMPLPRSWAVTSRRRYGSSPRAAEIKSNHIKKRKVYEYKQRKVAHIEQLCGLACSFDVASLHRSKGDGLQQAVRKLGKRGQETRRADLPRGRRLQGYGIQAWRPLAPHEA